MKATMRPDAAAVSLLRALVTSRLRFDKVGEIKQARIALSESPGTSLIRRVVDDDNLKQIGRNVVFYQDLERLPQHVVPVVRTDDRREGDLLNRRWQDRRAGEAIRIRGRHEGRCSQLAATMVARFERLPTADAELQTLFGDAVAGGLRAHPVTIETRYVPPGLRNRKNYD